MSQYLDLKPEFNIGVGDAQEMAKACLGRELSPDELEQVQRSVSNRLYEIECKMVEAEIGKLPAAKPLTHKISATLQELRKTASERGYGSLSDAVLTEAFERACHSLNEDLWSELEWQIEQEMDGLECLQRE